MTPEFDEGDFVVVARNPLFRTRISIGDTIIFHHSSFGTMIKKIEDILPNGDFSVNGLNKNCLDSNKLGYISSSSLIGKVIWHIHKN